MANGFTHFIYNILHEQYIIMRHSIFLMNPIGSVDIPWGIIELVLWRTALQADTYVFGFIRAHLLFVPMYTGYSW